MRMMMFFLVMCVYIPLSSFLDINELWYSCTMNTVTCPVAWTSFHLHISRPCIVVLRSCKGPCGDHIVVLHHHSENEY